MLAEITIEFLLNNPASIPQEWIDDLQSYYMKKDRKIAQYVDEIADYDSSLFYKLNPGNHTFNNREFETTIKVNADGFRAHTGSEKSPEVVFLGDSYTMGWGVNNDETFPSIISKTTGLRTLNTAVSSYGTVREMIVFNRLTTKHLKYVVIQYAFNDYWENSDYYFRHKLEVSEKAEYDATVDEHLSATKYFPLKHVSHFVRKWVNEKFPQPIIEEPSEESKPYVDQWRAFANVLKEMRIPESAEIVVVQVDNNDQQDVFLNPFRENLTTTDTNLAKKTHVLDLQVFLEEEHYFRLDGHLNVKGNQLVADTLSRFISHLEIDSEN